MPRYDEKGRDLHEQIRQGVTEEEDNNEAWRRRRAAFSALRNKDRQQIADSDIEYYWAYGSNLNIKHMRKRCPDARVHRPLIIKNAQLVFRGVADATTLEGAICPGGLWKITQRCLRSLDRYEGCDSDNPESKKGLYRRRFINVRIKGKQHKALFYQMNRPGIAPPGEFYLNTIIQGYKDFSLDFNELDAAVARSYDEKEWTDSLRERHEARGQKLARKDRVADLLVEQVVDVE